MPENTIYIAGPIDFAENDANVLLWRHLIKHNLKLVDWGFKDPSSVRWEKVPATAIWEHNQQWVIQSDGVLAFCPPGVVTIGTWMEVEFARERGIPLVVVGPVGSYQLKGAGIPVYPIRLVDHAISDLSEQIESKRSEIGLSKVLIDRRWHH